MTRFVDTHCHLNIMIKKEFDTALPDNFKELCAPIITLAQECGVSTLINVGTSLIESKNCLGIAQTFNNCFATLGIHPNDVKENWQVDIKEFESMLSKNTARKIVGIGEIGLDYHYADFNKTLQLKALHEQIELAINYDLAIVIHTRDAGQDVLAVLEEYKHKNIRGIIHCFSEDQAFAHRALDLGFLLGIGGPLTYPKNELLRTIFSSVPLESIVLETDAPYLPPQIIRGKQNSPAHIPTVGHFLAQLRKINVEEIAQVTTATALKLFGIPL